jgi:predicted  nucleic acid-binding Zn-ribbon protein
MTPLSSDLTALLELQLRDHALAESVRRRAAIPGRRHEVQKALVAARAAHTKAKHDLDAARMERRGLEKEIVGHQAEAARLERQLFDVKTNDEYKARQHQIAGVKEKRSALATGILEGMEREEWLEAAMKAEEQGEAAAAAAKADSDGALDSEQAALELEIAERTAARDRARHGVPAAVLSRYDRLLAARDGTAVVLVDNGACGACHRALTAHDLQIVKKGDTSHTCEECGRIVIYTDAAG